MRSLFYAVLALFTLTACGTPDFETEHVRDFRFFIKADEPKLKDTLSHLMEVYNNEIGFQAVTLVDNKIEANSFIRFPKGLLDDQNVLGYGQWHAMITEEGRDLLPSRKKLQRTIIHSMELEFDYNNFIDQASRLNEGSVEAWRHLFHLFAHEVGHGLQMEHESNQLSVMYSSIPPGSRPDVEYEDYFRKARKAFADQNIEVQ